MNEENYYLTLPHNYCVLFHAWIVWCIIGFVSAVLLVNLGNYHDNKKKTFTEVLFRAIAFSPMGALNLVGVFLMLCAITVKGIRKFSKH